MLSYCAPYGEKTPEPVQIQTVTVQPFDADALFTIAVNEKEIDLAYSYIPTANNRYTSLASLVGCPTRNTPHIIKEKKIETASIHSFALNLYALLRRFSSST